MGRREWMVVTVLVGMLAACRASLEDNIVGTWRNDEGGTKVVWFSKDGTFATEAPVGSARGRYQVDEDGKLRMDYDNQSAEMVISVSEDKLTLCQPEASRCDTYQKVQKVK